MAVMMDGEILQHDTPSEIYNNPINLQVAEFIGSPKINVIPAETDNVGKIICMGIPLPLYLKNYSEENILLGLRPEHTELIGKKENFFFEGKVNYKENLGSDIYLHVNLKDSQQNFIARSVPEKAFNLKIDDSVRIGYMIDKLLVFKKNGQSIPLQL